MEKRTAIFLMAFLVSVSLAGISYGDDVRADKKFGVYVSLLGDPFISLYGLNVAYNATDYLRVNGGVGYLGVDNVNITSVGLGVKALVPRWAFSPYFGLNYSQSFLSTNLGQAWFYTPSGNGNLGTSFSSFYPSLGFDYQDKSGFNLGLGVQFYTIQNTSGVLPGLNIGWFI
jgi:hypothetical protein